MPNYFKVNRVVLEKINPTFTISKLDENLVPRNIYRIKENENFMPRIFLFCCFTSHSTSLCVEPELSSRSSCSGTQHRGFHESQTSNPSIPSQILYKLSHCTPNGAKEHFPYLKSMRIWCQAIFPISN